MNKTPARPFAPELVDGVRVIDGFVQIGRFTYFDETLRFRRWTATEKIKLGNFCSIADGVTICVGGGHCTSNASTYPFGLIESAMGRAVTSTAYQTTRDTVVGNDVWIASRAYILGGAQIGDGAVVSAGAVVFGEVPPYAIVSGNPAQVVRYRFSNSTVERLLRLKWWDWPSEKIMGQLQWFHKPIQEFLDYFESNP